jgi:hypothetical protein
LCVTRTPSIGDTDPVVPQRAVPAAKVCSILRQGTMGSISGEWALTYF